MANLQYVGARYVPKFYENSLDPSSPAWEPGGTSGEGYEPMTVVTYLGDSYTSKKPVPGTVGDPAANPEYWAKTGEFNAAILALQNRMAAAEDDITEIKDRPRYIFIADSYGMDVGTQIGWITRVKSILGLTEGVNVFSYIQGGGGFIGNYPTTFETLLDTAYNDITDRDIITDIIVCGGYNDIGKAGLGGAVVSFMNKAQTYFPKAKVTLGFNAGYDPNTNPLNANNFLATKEVYTYVSGKMKSVPDLYSILLSLDGLFESDGIHPNSTGMNLLAIVTAQMILGGNTPESFAIRTMTMTPASGITVNGTPGRAWRRTKSCIRVWNAGASYSVNLPSDTRNTTAWLTIGNISGIVLNGLSADSDRSCLLPCYVTTSDNIRHFIVGNWSISPTGEVNIQIPMITSGGTFYKYSEVTNIDPLSMNGDFQINAMCV